MSVNTVGQVYGISQTTRRSGAILWLAVKKFYRIDGPQWAGAFAHYAFFSLIPLIILLVTVASFFIDGDQAAAKIIATIKTTIPIGGKEQQYIFGAISGVVEARQGAGIVAFVVLGWAAMRFFVTLIRATNRAWGTMMRNWWRLPLKSVVILVTTMGAVLLVIAAPVLAKMAKEWLFPGKYLNPWLAGLASYLIPMFMVFVFLSLFYRLAPRRSTRFAEVWVPAIITTILLKMVESLFVIYFTNFSSLNVIYGAFGGIMALLMWIYLSGCVFIFGACLCAAGAEV